MEICPFLPDIFLPAEQLQLAVHICYGIDTLRWLLHKYGSDWKGVLFSFVSHSDTDAFCAKVKTTNFRITVQALDLANKCPNWQYSCQLLAFAAQNE
jgi:hypothetical protein